MLWIMRVILAIYQEDFEVAESRGGIGSSSRLCSVQRRAEYSRTPCSSRSGISTTAVLCRGMLAVPPSFSVQVRCRRRLHRVPPS
jgi:hypothetical protein